MATYHIIDNQIVIDFHGVIPDPEIRSKMKAVKISWNPQRRVWSGQQNPTTIAIAKEICGDAPMQKPIQNKPSREYGLKLSIKEIVEARAEQHEAWAKELYHYVNKVMTDDNASHADNAVSQSQYAVWLNCFQFIAATLKTLGADKQAFELIFEYSMPGTAHERPDVILLTDQKVLSLEFKRKTAPQVDDNKDDVAQAIRYKEWMQNHHKVTKDRTLQVISYLICTHEAARSGYLRGIRILTKADFLEVLDAELDGQEKCSFSDEWLQSSKTEMPDMLQAIGIMYREGRIPYISDVNRKCLNNVLRYIEGAKQKHKKMLILINGVPGAGKTAVGQSIVYEENKNGTANAVYLSGNGPLVEVLQHQINHAGKHQHMGENAIQDMYKFKDSYFYSKIIPEQSILVFDESQRAWDKKKMNRDFSEPEGLFRLGDRIYKKKGYVVLVGLYGNGQAIYVGEEVGLPLWQEALRNHDDWLVISSSEISSTLQGLGARNIPDDELYLPVSLRADFIDCSPWVEQAIRRNGATIDAAKKELARLQKTSMRICVTRDMNQVRIRAAEMAVDHPEWKYGILISNFAEQDVVRKALPQWMIGYHEKNVVGKGGYGPWFDHGCKKLDQACSVYGNQGLELDCPIILFGGEYIRSQGQWIPRGDRYESDKKTRKYEDPDTIVENNFRVLLTRARKEMILLIPNDPILDETYQYFLNMGMDELS